MVAKSFLVDLNLNQQELQNYVVQNLATAPANPVVGQEYFNTTDSKKYIYTSAGWVDETNQGEIYSFTGGLVADSTNEVTINLASGTALSINASQELTIASASNTAEGTIRIATDAEVETGTSEVLAVNPKQLADAIAECITLDNLSIASTSADYLTYDNTTGEFGANVDTAVTEDSTNLVTSGAVFDVVEPKIELTDLSVASASADYLTYNNATGEFGANVDTTVTDSSTNLVTSGAVATAIANAISAAVIYKGTWAAAGQSDYSAIALPVKAGYLYYVSSGEDVTIDGITWNQGDYLLVNEDVAEGGTITSAKVQKIDNTEASDIVRLNATQTLTNKTIDATDNTISNLATANFASGVIGTTINTGSSASDDVIPTEKAVADFVDDATEGMVTVDGTQTLTNKTIDADDNTISDLELDNFKSGVVVDSTTGIAPVSTASDTAVATEKAIASALTSKTNKLIATNPALTPASGTATWTITNSIGSADVTVKVRETATGAEVVTNVSQTAASVVISFNANDTVAADTYTAVIVG